MPENYMRKVDRLQQIENHAHAADLVHRFVGAMRKRAAIHATEAEQKNRARTADPPATGGPVQQAVAKIAASGTKPAREMSPRIRKKISIPPDAFMSRQRVGADGGMIQRYRGR